MKLINRKEKNKFYAISFGIFVLMLLIRLLFPSVVKQPAADAPESASQSDLSVSESALLSAQELDSMAAQVDTFVVDLCEANPTRNENDVCFVPCYSGRTLDVGPDWHSVEGFKEYDKAFPDSQALQIVSAERWGIEPAEDRDDAESRKRDLVYVGTSPYYHVDPKLHSSIPYLVPRASMVLERLGKAFYDSLYVRNVPLHKFIVTSLLRTEDDVEKLRKHNPNAHRESCHRYGTTFDISYTRFFTVKSPDEEKRRMVRDDTLKFVLAQVLRDFREDSLIYVKYEKKRSCFHITTR